MHVRNPGSQGADRNQQGRHLRRSRAAKQVDRAALPSPKWSEKVVPPYLPPQNRLEMEVQLIWVAVMNKKEMISCDADFSAVGGNMMHAVISNGIVRYWSSPAFPSSWL